MRVTISCCLLLLTASVSVAAVRVDGNRLTYLDENNPYYVGQDFPKLTTPQWVGEDGVEAVVILAIDDMRDTAKYEKYLRPILIRLRQIDGRAPVSIMTCNVNPKDEQLQQWLAEGLSIEIHTVDHPCPLLKDGDFKKAKSTYDRCVDLMHQIPGNKPVAFRMPCCDSLNTVSPRFYAEIFNKTTKQGHFLSIDTSVFNVFTSNDPEIPRELVIDADGRDKFLKYLPRDRTFVNTIENYPYPYVINRLCWEFPCLAPSDWSAQHYHGKNNSKTVEDWKAALDITVIKQGVLSLVFHPHGWIRNDQVIELINHAVKKHGKKVKFLTFREAQERLNKNVLAGQPLRNEKGNENGVRVLDIDNDGNMDVVTANKKLKRTRIWSPQKETWIDKGFPYHIVAEASDGKPFFPIVSFGIHSNSGLPSVFHAGGGFSSQNHFERREWSRAHVSILSPSYRSSYTRNLGIRMRDLDGDGSCELLLAMSGRKCRINSWSEKKKRWIILPITLPAGTALARDRWIDAGLRFIDINEDGHDDVVFSDHKRYSIHLWNDMKTGWSRTLFSHERGDKNAIIELPPIVREDGSDNGFFVHSRHLFWQNEDTAKLKDLVARRSFNELLKNAEPRAKSAEASLRSIQTRPGFKVQLVAAEPLVMDPVAFEWGADGKLWVAEMADYPNGLDGRQQPGGRIRFLEDTNGDGKYDRSTVFLDKVNFPNGVMPWHDGVLISAAPDIIYAEDIDGDGKADKRVVLFTGLVEGNQQHRANGFVYGLDNWIYCANGDSGGKVKSLKTGRVVDIRGRDFRIKPDTGDIDTQSGQTQFGRNRDDWGNWFGGNNSNPMWHYVLDDHYTRRNPHVAAPDPRVHVSVAPGAAPCFPISRTLARFNDLNKANRFTSACSTMVYRDELFFPGDSKSSSRSGKAAMVFVSEPVHNLVHREVMTAKGNTFTSQRAVDEQTSEFLASSDNWFRPTMIKTGPDGALWIADMYRYVIEHPKWIPADWQKRLDLRAGHDKGRIYRVLPVAGKTRNSAKQPEVECSDRLICGSAPTFRMTVQNKHAPRPRPIPRLDKLDTAELVAALDSPNGWQRDTAQRLLIHRKDKTAIPLLEKQAIENRRPLCRLHALYTVDGLNGLTESTLLRALDDEHPGVRRHAVRLCESLPSHSAEILRLLAKLGDDPDPQVRLQLACTVGEIDAPAETSKILAHLLERKPLDRFLYAAAVSSINKRNVVEVFERVTFNPEHDNVNIKIVAELMRIAVAFGNRAALQSMLRVFGEPDENAYPAELYPLAAGLLDTFDRQKTSLAKLRDDADRELRQSLEQFRKVFRAARRTVRNQKAPIGDRTTAAQLLGRDLEDKAADLDLLAGWLNPQTDLKLQHAAVRAMGRVPGPRVPSLLLKNWKSYAPTRRTQVLDVLLSRGPWQSQLLDSLEQRRIETLEIDAARRQRLLTLTSASLRLRAAKLFHSTANTNRQKVVESYRDVLKLDGNRVVGAAVFKKSCSACHRLNNVGNSVGADLVGLRDKSPTGLLTAILDPNRAIEAKFVGYTAATNDGRVYAGMLLSETGNSITLANQDGKHIVILRAELDALASTNKSFMPEGFEKKLSKQDLADVIAYVAATGPPPKSFAGNKPEVVVPDPDGSIALLATNCQVFGKTIVFEDKYQNLGYWSSEDDRAVWQLEVSKAGKYAVHLNYACADSTAGNRFTLEAGDIRLSGKVASTGTWDIYRDIKLGEVELKAGPRRFTFHSDGPPNGHLLDLKRILLVPIR